MTQIEKLDDHPMADPSDENTLYTGTIMFYSKGTGQDVSLDCDFSHNFPDGYEGPAPAALKCLRDVWFSLMASSDRMPPLGFDQAELEGLEPDEAHRKILEVY